MAEAEDNPGFWGGLLGGVVGFFTGGPAGAVVGAATGWVGEDQRKAAEAAAKAAATVTVVPPVTGVTGLGTGQSSLPTMTGSGLGTLSSGAMPGVADANLYGAPGADDRLASVRAFGERLARVRAFAAQLAATRPGAQVMGLDPRTGMPLAVALGGVPVGATGTIPSAAQQAVIAAQQAALLGGVPPAGAAAPVVAAAPAVPWWQTLAGAVGGWIAGREDRPPEVMSILDQPSVGSVSPTGVMSIF